MHYKCMHYVYARINIHCICINIIHTYTINIVCTTYYNKSRRVIDADETVYYLIVQLNNNYT